MIIALAIAFLVITPTVIFEYHPSKVKHYYPIEQVIAENTTFNWTSAEFLEPVLAEGGPLLAFNSTSSNTSIFGHDGNLSTLGLNAYGYEYYIPGYGEIFYITIFVNGTLDPKLQPSNFSIIYTLSVTSDTNGTNPYITPGDTLPFEHVNTSANYFDSSCGTLQLYNDNVNSTEPYHFHYKGQAEFDAMYLQKNITYSLTIATVLNGLQKQVGSSITLNIKDV